MVEGEKQRNDAGMTRWSSIGCVGAVIGHLVEVSPGAKIVRVYMRTPLVAGSAHKRGVCPRTFIPHYRSTCSASIECGKGRAECSRKSSAMFSGR